MTKDECYQWADMAGFSRAEIEEVAAEASMTGHELIEFVIGCTPKMLEEIAARRLGAPRNAVVAQVSGNVIQVNFKPKAAGRKTHQAPAKRRQAANRVSLIPIRVPSTSPTVNSTAVPSTSPDTVIPYSSC